MRDRTRKLWASQERHPGDRERLLRAVAGFADVRSVLYPGSWVDVAASRRGVGYRTAPAAYLFRRVR